MTIRGALVLCCRCVFRVVSVSLCACFTVSNCVESCLMSHCMHVSQCLAVCAELSLLIVCIFHSVRLCSELSLSHCAHVSPCLTVFRVVCLIVHMFHSV